MLLDPLVQRRSSEVSPTFADFLSIAHREPPLSAQELLSAWMDCDSTAASWAFASRARAAALREAGAANAAGSALLKPGIKLGINSVVAFAGFVLAPVTLNLSVMCQVACP